MNRKNIIILLCFFYIGCNKQSTALQYTNLKSVERIDGYSRDMFLQNDTLFVVSEDDGLLIYKIQENSESGNLSLALQYSDSLEFQSKGWNLNHVVYSSSLNSIFILDKFYSIQSVPLSDFYTNNCFMNLSLEECNDPCAWDESANICSAKLQFDSICCNADSHHPSTFTIYPNDEIFTLVRHKSGQEGIPTDVVSIYEIGFLNFGDLVIAEPPLEVVNSIIYDATDIFYGGNKLFISHTDYENNQFSIYTNNNSTYALDSVISVPYKPATLYGNNEYVFVGMSDHGGVKIYNINSLEEVNWGAQGFSIRNIHWDSLNSRLLLSCGYQGVIIFELDNIMNVANSWVLNTSYAYTTRYYNGYALIATREGIEIIKVK